MDAYLVTDDPTRQRIRELFQANRSFAWAATLPRRPIDVESLRKHLALVSIHDQVPDPRDTIVWLDHILREARDAGVDLRAVAGEVARITSDVDRWRFGSTRQLMLGQRHDGVGSGARAQRLV